MAIIYRANKGSALTNNELDGNFFDLDLRVNQNSQDLDVLTGVTIPEVSDALTQALANKQPLNNNLTSLSNNSLTGLVTQSSSGVITTRTFEASDNITITNGDGVAGNPIIGINLTEVVTRSGAYTLTNKSISGTTNNITNISLTTSVSGLLPISHGGTGSNTPASARIALDVLQRPGSLGIVVASSLYGSVTRSLQVAGAGLTVLHNDGVNSNPTIALASATTNTPNAVVIRDSNGNFSAGTITATLNGTASSALTVSNGVYTSATYNNPSWITGLAGSKVTNIPNTSLVNSTITINGIPVALGDSTTLSPEMLSGSINNTPNTLVLRDASGNFVAGTITGNLTGLATNATSALVANQALSLSGGGRINGTVFNGVTDIVVYDNTKLPLAGGSLTGDLYVRDYKGIYLQSSTPSSYLRITKDNSNQGLIKNYSGDLTIAAEDYINLIFDHQGSYGGLRIGKQQSGDGAFQTLMEVNLAGKLSTSLTATAYKALITDDRDIPNKKYVDDLVSTLTNVTTASRLNPGATINGVLFTGQSNITIGDDTKLPLSGGTMTGDVYYHNKAGLFFRTGTTGTPNIKLGWMGNNQGILRNESSNFTVSAEDNLNLIYDSWGGAGNVIFGHSLNETTGAFTAVMTLNRQGKLFSNMDASSYVSLLTGGSDIPNKKYVDDKFASIASVTSATTASILNPGATINGVLFTGQSNITVVDNTKLPLAGGTMTGNITMNANQRVILNQVALPPGESGGQLYLGRNTSGNGIDIDSETQDGLWIGSRYSTNILIDKANAGNGNVHFTVSRFGARTGYSGGAHTNTPIFRVYNTGLIKTMIDAGSYVNLMGTDAATIPNKQYVDNKFASITSVLSATTASRLNPGATINGVLFTGQSNITVVDNTKLPLAGGTMTGKITSIADEAIGAIGLKFGSSGKEYLTLGRYVEEDTGTKRPYAHLRVKESTPLIISTDIGPVKIAIKPQTPYDNFTVGSWSTKSAWPDIRWFIVETNGLIRTGLDPAVYANLITAETYGAWSLQGTPGQALTNRKYVDDKFASITSVLSATTASRLSPGANINGVLFTGQSDITVFDNTKLPLSGGTIPVTGSLTAKTVEHIQSTTVNITTGYFTPNWNTGTIVRVTASSNFTLAAPDNMPVGSYMTLIITQDVTGNRTMTPVSTYKFASGFKNLSFSPNAIDVVSIFKAASDELFATITNSYS